MNIFPNEYPKNQYEIANEILSNLSNLAKIPTQYYDYDSGLKLLHSLAKFEYKNTLKKDLPANPSSLEDSSNETALSLKRHSSFSLDHYYKGVYKLRRFEKNNSLNLESLLQQLDSSAKVNFEDLVPKKIEEIIEPHMIRVINLHTALYESLYEKGLQEIEETSIRDEILLKAFQKKIKTLLKAGVVWLNKELLRNLKDPSRYNLILDKILDLLNTHESIKQICEGGSQEDLDWSEFFKKIPIYSQKVLLHMSLVCETLTQANNSRIIFLESFKRTILNNLEKKDLCFYGLNLFLNLVNRDAFAIINRCFWPIVEFREFIASNAEKVLESMKNSSENSMNIPLSEGKIKDFTIKYLHVLSKKPQMIENLISSFSELAPIAQQVILDKFEILAKEKFLDHISLKTMIKLFKNPKNNEKLLMKFVERYKKEPEALARYEENILPEINNFCLSNNFINGLTEILFINSENEFERIQNQLILTGNEAFFIEIIPILFEKNRKLAEMLFFKTHVIHQEIDVNPEQNSLIMKIYDIFLKNEKIFAEKTAILTILNKIVNREVISPLIMKTVLQTYMVFFKRGEKEEIFDGLVEIVKNLIDRGIMENEKIWTGMKYFFRYDLKKCVNLLQSLPENYKKDFFKE